MENDTDARERLFHNAIREILIHALFFLILYVFAHILVSKFRKKKEYYFAEDDEDAIVCRVSLWMCCFSLAVSLGAALLLPVSIISNEVLLLYPSSFYVQWLNSSLIHGLWNEIFLFSNISIFILLPFAYLFTESEGLPGSQKGLISRFYETFLVFTLVAALLFGMTFLLSAILDYGQTSMQSLFALWCGYLPFLYSCLSCFGVVLLLICTPVGFARLFTVLGELVIKPKFLRDIQDEHQCAMMEEENLRRRAHIISHELEIHHSTPVQRIRRNGCAASALKQRLLQVGKVRRELASSSGSQAPQPSACASSACCHTTNWETAATSGTSYMALQQLASPWRRNLGYPLAMLVLLSLTIISLLMVIHNMLQLLIGIKALPISPQVEKFSLGISSLSALGVVGSSLEIVLILYPYQRCLLPRSTYELHVSCGLIVVCEYGAESCSGLAIQANALRIIPELYQLPVAGICGGFLLTACLLSATTEAIISHCDANHRQLCHPACAQFCTACTCQDTGMLRKHTELRIALEVVTEINAQCCEQHSWSEKKVTLFIADVAFVWLTRLDT
ncbi:LMBR1-like protein lilipod isoform X11 [Rhipicephalus microplus]|uniref:LMBR1-like protein lilipod isoform X11 n=1 Tax=Rhipicephalus microplus TaxID=6941 RepID=UPI003F6CF5A9